MNFGANILFCGAVIALAAGWGWCLYSYSHRSLRRPATTIAVMLPLTAAVIWAAVTYRQHTTRLWQDRLLQLQAAASGAAPLITSIRAFSIKNGRPPATLAAIPAPPPPPTAVAETPAWSYGVPGQVGGPPTTPSDRWALGFRVKRDFCTRCGLSFGDTFVYHSDGVYPKHLYGGVLERVGAWGYYHE